MQTIGLVGGMSWESSAAYYKALNLGVAQRLGGLSSAKVVLSSLDFAELTTLQAQERWDEVAAVLVAAAQGLERAGADVLLLCTTTFHRVADEVAARGRRAAAAPRRRRGRGLPGAQGLRGGLPRHDLHHGAQLLHRPPRRRRADRARAATEHHAELNRIIYEELVHGRVEDSSRRFVVDLISQLWDAGAGGVVLGCTELELLVRQADSELPVFPSTTLHVEAALDRALG